MKKLSQFKKMEIEIITNFISGYNAWNKGCKEIQHNCNFPIYKPCEVCGGDGHKGIALCDNCSGEGHLEEKSGIGVSLYFITYSSCPTVTPYLYLGRETLHQKTTRLQEMLIWKEGNKYLILDGFEDYQFPKDYYSLEELLKQNFKGKI